MYLDELRIGMEWEIPPVRIELDKMLDFARLYDPLPLHLDADYASTTRFGGLIAPGVMSFMSVWAEFVRMGVFGGQLVAGKSTKIEWFAPVRADDVLQGRIWISNIIPRNSHNGIAETSLEVKNQHGEVVLKNVTQSVVCYRE